MQGRVGTFGAHVSLLTAAVFAVVHPTAGSSQESVSADIVHRIDSTLRADVANGFSGVVLVASHETVLVDSGYGIIRGVPVRKDMPFWIASTAKQFVSAAILKCQERGLLTLDDSLATFFSGVPTDKRQITIRQLLSHTSGLGQGYVSEGQPSRERAVRLMLAEPLAQSPGGRFRYSNSNIQLAAAIVEEVSRVSYQAFVMRELWLPAGLQATGFAADRDARFVAPAVGDTPQRLSASSWGAEGVYSTTGDLLRWYRGLRGERLLSARSVEQLFAPVAPISEGQTALAWFWGRSPLGRPLLFTRGNEDFGANSLIYVYPDREIVIVVLTHAGNAGAQLSWSRLVHAQIQNLLSL